MDHRLLDSLSPAPRRGRRSALHTRAGALAALGVCWFFASACESSSGDGDGSGGSGGAGGSESGGTGTAGTPAGGSGAGAGRGGSGGAGETGGAGGEAGAGASGEAGTGGTAGEAGGGGAGGATAGGGTGGAGPDACESVRNESLAASAVTISVVNNRSSAVWLQSRGRCDFEPRIAEMPGDRAVLWTQLLYTCEDHLERNTCPEGAVCQGSVVRLGAGESIEFAWWGLDASGVDFSAECEPERGCSNKRCTRLGLAPPATYQVSLTGDVFGACTGDNCDTCQVRAGNCYSYEFLDLSEPLFAAPSAQSFDYPEILNGTAIVVFEID